MSDKTKDTNKLLKRPLRRRDVLKRGLAGSALVAGSSIFAPRILRAAGGSITIGSFQDNAMAPFRDYFVKEFATKTGITVNYNETNYDTWYQNCKNDGLNKTGAYDIYVMDDNWVPEFAAGKIVQSLDQLGLKANPDILPAGLNMGMWPPVSGPRMKDFAGAKPELYALVIIDDVEILYYNKDHFPTPPVTWDDIYAVAKTTKAPDMYGWSPRGVKGNPIVQTYLPLLNSYGGNFVNDDWTPGFAGPEGVGALSRLFSFIPYMPEGVAEYDTDQEVQLMLEGKCTALTEYTGLAQRVDDPASSKVVGKINMAATPKQVKSRAGHRHLHRRHRLGRQESGRRGAVPGMVHLGRDPARVRPEIRRGGGDGHGAPRSGGGEGPPLAAGDRRCREQLGGEAADAGRAEDGGHPRHRPQPGAGGGHLRPRRITTRSPRSISRTPRARSRPI